MDKYALTRRLAREWHKSQARAADYVDTLVYSLLKTPKRDDGKAPEDKPALSGTAPKEKT